MADTTSTAGIRINADASGVAGAAKEGAEALGRLGDETKKLTGAGKDAREAAAAFTQRLKEQADTLGMSRIQIEQYKAAQLDLNTQQRASVQASLAQIEAHDRLTQSTARGTSATLEFMKAMAGYDVIRSAASALADYAKEATLLATRHETLGVVMTVVGRNAGYTAGEMAMYAEGVRKMGITMVQSRESVVKMAQANIDLGKATELARVAQDAAVIGNTNSSEALGRLIYGIQSAQTDVLRTIGINVNFENSYKKVAAAIGKTTEDLTESEKAQSRVNTVLEAGTRIAGTYEAAMGTAGKQMGSLARYAEDLKVLRGEIFNEALVIAVSNYTDALKASDAEARRLAENNAFKQWGREMIETSAFVGDAVRGAWDVFAQGVESSAVVVLQSLNAIVQVGKYTPQGALLNWATGVADKVSGFTGAFTDKANENLQARLNRPQLRDTAAEYFAQRDRDEAAMKRRQGEADFWGAAKTPDAPDGGGAARSNKISDYERLIKIINEKNAVQTLEESIGRKLIASEADALKVMTGLRDGTLKMTDAQKMEIATKLEGTIVSEKANIARERYTKQTEQAVQAHARWLAGEEQATVKLEMQNRKLAEHNQTIGLSSEQLRALTVTRAEEALALAEQAEQMAILDDTQEVDIGMMHRRTEAAREFLDLTREGAARQAWAEQTKRMTEANDRMRDNLERGLTDSIIRGFDKGKPFARNFLDSLETLFKSAILTPIIQPLVRPVAGAITGVVQGAIGSLFPGTASAGGFGDAFGLASAGNTVSGWVGGPTISSALGSVGGGFFSAGSAGAAASLGELGINTAAMSSGALEAAAASGVGASSGISAALGSVPGWGWAALAAAAVLGSGLLDSNGPKGSEAWLQGGPGSYNIGIDNAAGGDPDMNQVRALNALLQDSTKYDQSVLQQFVGQRIGNGSPQDTGTLISQLTQALAPAAQTAQDQLNTQKALLAKQDELKATLGAIGPQLAEKLGIGTLQAAQNALATSEYNAPLERFSAAKAQLEATYGSAIGGDLTAVQSFPQMLQSALSIGRDVYASGPEFADFFKTGNRMLQDLLDHQKEVQTDILRDLPATVVQASNDQVAELRRGFGLLASQLTNVEAELRRLNAVAA